MEYELKGFWDKVDIKSADECWEWKGGKLTHGHRQLQYRSNKLNIRLAHRLAWVLYHQKEVPKGFIIYLICDNPKCCNPTHLFLAKKGRSDYERYYGIPESLARLANNK